MIRLAAAGADASTAKVSEWMTGDPTRSAPDVEARAAFAALGQHGYRHIPVVDGGRARRHRLDARPHARRDDPARRRAGPRGPEGPRRRRRRRHDRRRRPRPRRLLPLPPVQRGRPREARPLEDVWYLLFDGRLPDDARRARRVRRRDRAAGARFPTRSPTVLPAIARAGDTFVPLDALRTALSLFGAALGFRRVARHRRRDAARERDGRRARSCRR